MSTYTQSDDLTVLRAELHHGTRELESLAGQIDFIVANPPASEGDDGFGWRRRVLAGARKYLAASGRMFLSVSSQYGMRRVMGLLDDDSVKLDVALLIKTNRKRPRGQRHSRTQKRNPLVLCLPSSHPNGPTAPTPSYCLQSLTPYIV